MTQVKSSIAADQLSINRVHGSSMQRCTGVVEGGPVVEIEEPQPLPQGRKAKPAARHIPEQGTRSRGITRCIQSDLANHTLASGCGPLHCP